MTEGMTPGRFTDLEEGLRRSFAEQAESISPSERLAQIRSEIDANPRRRVRAWLAPVAASVAVLLVGGLVWLLLVRPSGSGPVAVVTDTATSTVAPTPTSLPPNQAPNTLVPPPASPSEQAGSQALPVYYVGPGTTAVPWLLYRTFLPEQGVGTDPSALAGAAVGIALSGQDDHGRSLTAYEGYLQPWQPGTTATTTVRPAEISVVLSRPGRSGLTEDQQRIAVQQLVWTATAAASANRPVRVTTSSGEPIFQSMPGGVYQRPEATYEDLAPLWITDPSRYVPVANGRPVVVSGQACVFEAQFAWELSRGGGVIRSGTATASSGCPQRGTYSIDLGALPAGDYSIRVFERSAKDGSVFAETRSPFTVAGS